MSKPGCDAILTNKYVGFPFLVFVDHVRGHVPIGELPDGMIEQGVASWVTGYAMGWQKGLRIYC